MTRHPYVTVDVFTDRPFGGNPLAVFPDARDIPPERFPAIARELSLSETTFVLPAEDAANHFRVRIFTPAAELPMAGHPTVGTAFVLCREGRFDPAANGGLLRLEEGVGPVPVTVEMEPGGAIGQITMQQKQPEFGAVFADRAAAAAALSLTEADLLPGAPVQMVSCGVPFWFIGLRSRAAIARARARADVWDQHFASSPAHALFCFTLETEHPGSHVHSRMFGVGLGIGEDPATGGASGPLGGYLLQHGLLPRASVTTIVSEQGIEMGRPSFLTITVHSQGDAVQAVYVGGRCVPMGRGELEL